jgi:anaerobic selenocysteine-containing dehydrogenase
MRTVKRACNLCEAICGLEFRIDGAAIVAIRGDAADPFSRGHLCPKAVALKDIHEDPNRLRAPLVKRDGRWQSIGWDEAFALAGERLGAVVEAHGDDAVGMYIGNPSVHNSGTLLNVGLVARALKTHNVFSATSVDQLPQQLVAYLMFGHQFLIPIPDIDRTDFFLVLGGNPIASNGSMMTVPDVAKRLKALQARGGRLVVIDPRRTETAEVASEHHFIRPGTDAALLMALINVIVAEQRSRITHADRLEGLDAALAAIAHVTPARAARVTGIEEDTIVRLAREFAGAERAVCYGRLGTTLQAFGTLNQWIVQLLNLVTGNLDREGGALLTHPLFPMTGPGTRRGHFGVQRSRVSGVAGFAGELPSAVIAEEILTPGRGQIRAMVTVAGNPVLSTPDGRRLDRAFEALEFMVAVDIFLNETTRHADLILPPASSLKHDHYDTVFNAFAVRNVARYNPAIWSRGEDERLDWEILGALASAIARKLGRETRAPQSTRDAVQRALEAGGRMTLEELCKHESGLDLGPLRPSLFERLETADRKLQCAPPDILADLARFDAEVLDAPAASGLTLIGRRHVRSNNSWMHQSHRLVKGKPRHQLMMHARDAAALGIADGSRARVTSATGTLSVDVEITDDIMPGVVSLPHGWGHDRPGTRLGLAHDNPGVSYNDLTSCNARDAVSGNAAMNGIPVRVEACA